MARPVKPVLDILNTAVHFLGDVLDRIQMAVAVYQQLAVCHLQLGQSGLHHFVNIWIVHAFLVKRIRT